MMKRSTREEGQAALPVEAVDGAGAGAGVEEVVDDAAPLDEVLAATEAPLSPPPPPPSPPPLSFFAAAL